MQERLYQETREMCTGERFVSHLLQLNFYERPPLYKDHSFGGQSIIDTLFYLSTTTTSLQQPLSSIPKAVGDGFNCNCNITSENTVRLLYSLFCSLKGLNFTSFSHPSHKNHQGSFHLSPNLDNRNFFS